MSTFAIIGEQYKKLPVLIDANTCGGKTYIVTGGNTGIGLETARHLVAAQAARVIISSRNVSAGERAAADIERTTGRKGVVEVWQLDLASFDSTKAFARRAEAELERIDALVENAGVMLDKFDIAEGNEVTMTVNVISTVLLAVLLMPKLQETHRKYGVKPRIVMVGSALAFQANKELAKGGKQDIIKNLNNATVADRYPLTKLVELYALRQFAKEFPVSKTGVIINMTAPGVCSTGLAKDTGVVTRATVGLIRVMFARTPEEGSRTSLHGIVAEEDSHGKFCSGCKIKDDSWVGAHDWIINEDGQKTQKQLWKEIVGFCEQAEPGCVSRLR